MGWLMFLLIAALTAGLLWWIGFPRRFWSVAATGLTLGAAGYAWQGSPGVPGHPAAHVEQASEVDPDLVRLREAMFGRFDLAYSYFGAADAMLRSGDTERAVEVMLGATRSLPTNAAMWTGLGLTLAQNDGTVSPASKLAFDRALKLAPNHPGPPFFLGLAHIRSGQFAEARPWWEKALALTPANATYHDEVMVRLYLLDRFLQAQAEMQRRGQGGADSAPAAPAPAR